MTQQSKDQNQKTEQTHPYPPAKENQEKQKAAENEVAGRHKNDGKNDNAGHKTAR